MERNQSFRFGRLEDPFPFFSWVICMFQPFIFQGLWFGSYLFSGCQKSQLHHLPPKPPGGLPGICSLVSGCQLVRTTLGSWRSRSWSTALGAGLWYSFVSGLDRIKLGGQRRGLNGLPPCPRTCSVLEGLEGDVVEKVVWKCKQAHSEDWWVWISDVAPGNNGHDVKGQFRNQNSPKPQNV